MKVKILNPDIAKQLFKSWGEASSVCYATETDTPETIGKGCMYSGHYSGSRGDYIKFLVTEVPRFTIDQAVRHEIGVFKNVGSFRYIDKGCFQYEIPIEITDNPELVNEYCEHMENTVEMYKKIQSYVKSKGKTDERANEQARYVLPMATHSAFVIGFTVEALTHFCNMRLCVRAEDIIRNLAIEMKKATIEILPELAPKLVPNCQAFLFCPEGKRSCGAYPTKKELTSILSNLHNNKKENEYE